MASLRLRRRRNDPESFAGEIGASDIVPLQERRQGQPGIQRRGPLEAPINSVPPAEAMPQIPPDAEAGRHTIHVRVGIVIIVPFFCMYEFWEKNCLLLISPSWDSGRDCLPGLAIIQAFPGPNSNFCVYLGALAMQKNQFPTIFGAFLGFVGLFAPGLTLLVGVQIDLLRGVHATVFGLVFTAVYRLWEIGYLTAERSSGRSLGLEPWWVVTAAVSYAENAWFRGAAFLLFSSHILLLFLVYARHSVSMCLADCTPRLHGYFGESNPGTFLKCKTFLRPIFSVPIYTTRALASLQRPLCNFSVVVVSFGQIACSSLPVFSFDQASSHSSRAICSNASLIVALAFPGTYLSAVYPESHSSHFPFFLSLLSFARLSPTLSFLLHVTKHLSPFVSQ